MAGGGAFHREYGREAALYTGAVNSTVAAYGRGRAHIFGKLDFSHPGAVRGKFDKFSGLHVVVVDVPFVVDSRRAGDIAIRKSFFDVILMAAFGLLGFFMRKGGFATAPMVLGLILSDHLESYFRRALILARGDIWGYFLTRPIAIVLAILIVLSLALPFITKAMKKRKAAKAAASQGG